MSVNLDGLVRRGAELGAPYMTSYWYSLSADLHLLRHDRKAAMASLDAGLADAERMGVRWWTTELHRQRAVTLANSAREQAVAEAGAAIDIARDQGALDLLRRAEATLDELEVERVPSLCPARLIRTRNR